MKVVLVFFEKFAADDTRGFRYACLSLARKLDEAGLLGHMICLDAPHDIGLDRSRVIALNRHPLFRLAHEILGRLSRIIPAFDTRALRERLFDHFIVRNLDMQRGDLLFLSRPLFLEAARAARRQGIPVWVQSSVPHPLVNYALVRNEEIRLGLRQFGAYSDVRRAERLARTITAADRVVTLGPAIGRYTYNTYLEMLGPDRILPLEKVFAMDIAEFATVAAGRGDKAPGDEVTFLHVSHINLIKGIPYLLDAWRRLQEQGHTNCRLILAGRIDVSIADLIRERYSDLTGFEHRGFVPDLVGAYAGADVFVSPSISDNGPGTIIEAMAAGMPVVSSRNCGLASLVTEGENGFTYDYNDVDHLARALAWFADHPERIAEMGRNARRRMDDLADDPYTDEILGHVQRLRDGHL